MKTNKKIRIQLPNNSSCTYPTVNPEDWQSGGKQLLEKNWEIQYRFHDPKFKEKYPYGFRKRIKLMNSYTTLSERREATKLLLENELRILKDGYNPITDTYNSEIESQYEISSNTEFIAALRLALDKKNPATYDDYKSVIKYVELAAMAVGMNTKPVGEIRKKNIKTLFDYMPNVNNNWTANNFNRFRKLLSSLFLELLEYEAVEYDPVKGIRKQIHTQKIRETLTKEEEGLVVKHLKENNPTFFRFIQIFFHSGARIAELLRMRVKDVNLKEQKFKVVFKKGKQSREVEHVIKDIALSYWSELLMNSKQEDYVFSKGLIPGPKEIRREQVTRRWETHVKDKLGITADLYSLKHLNTDQTAELLSMNDAATHNVAKITTTEKYYAGGEKERKNQRLKNLNNPFGE